ncbi:MAG: hypothetical protein MO846_02700 [Candidatus Devosia symbiotica]|nr:hypothetical protein [Candidatus Devosia symbiotica]
MQKLGARAKCLIDADNNRTWMSPGHGFGIMSSQQQSDIVPVTANGERCSFEYPLVELSEDDGKIQSDLLKQDFKGGAI